MRAFVITGPGEAGVQEVAAPQPRAGEVVVEVERAGICGTDVEFFTGEMSYLHTGQARYPIRIGHEWAGTVAAVGDGVDRSWIGRRVTGDTQLGCGRCTRCRGGRQHVCADRYATGTVDPRPLVAATVGLDDTAAVLAGEHHPDWGNAPKIHVDPRR